MGYALTNSATNRYRLLLSSSSMNQAIRVGTYGAADVVD
jgi:hypothetical protein